MVTPPELNLAVSSGVRIPKVVRPKVIPADDSTPSLPDDASSSSNNSTHFQSSLFDDRLHTDQRGYLLPPLPPKGQELPAKIERRDSFWVTGTSLDPTLRTEEATSTSTSTSTSTTTEDTKQVEKDHSTSSSLLWTDLMETVLVTLQTLGRKKTGSKTSEVGSSNKADTGEKSSGH